MKRIAMPAQDRAKTILAIATGVIIGHICGLLAYSPFWHS
jgi:hypothetical protein